MVDQEMLQAMAALIKAEITPINERLDKIEIKMEDLESEVKQSKRELRNEIRKTADLVLDEVERVHGILDAHKADKSKHTA